MKLSLLFSSLFIFCLFSFSFVSLCLSPAGYYVFMCERVTGFRSPVRSLATVCNISLRFHFHLHNEHESGLRSKSAHERDLPTDRAIPS